MTSTGSSGTPARRAATGDGQSTITVESVTTVADVDGNELGGTDGDSVSVSAGTSGGGNPDSGGSDVTAIPTPTLATRPMTTSRPNRERTCRWSERPGR